MARVWPVAVFVISTLAFGTTAPEGSVTTPTTDPKVVWALAVGAAQAASSSTRNGRVLTSVLRSCVVLRATADCVVIMSDSPNYQAISPKQDLAGQGIRVDRP